MQRKTEKLYIIVFSHKEKHNFYLAFLLDCGGDFPQNHRFFCCANLLERF